MLDAECARAWSRLAVEVNLNDSDSDAPATVELEGVRVKACELE